MVNNIFTHSSILEKALDAVQLRHDVISHNIANGDTPGYKKQGVAFEEYLQKALDTTNKPSQIDLSSLSPRLISQVNSMSTRMDGNNVDPEVETVELAKNQMRGQALSDYVAQDMKRFKIVLNAR